jgi:hypothetical protein
MGSVFKGLSRWLSLDFAQRLQPKQIVEEIKRNMMESRIELPYRVVLPGHYYVYLHPSDYKRIRPVAPLLVEDAVKALQEFIRDKKYQLATSPLEIAVYEDLEGEVTEGEVLVQSECLIPAEDAADMEGIKTVRITRSTNPQQSQVTSQTTGPTQVLAEFHHDENGRPSVFSMTRQKIIIGRRTSTESPDLALSSTRSISRRHAEVSFNEASKKFFITDLGSTFGTTVNGRKIAAGERVELSLDAQIGLADVVVLRFVPKT